PRLRLRQAPPRAPTARDHTRDRTPQHRSRLRTRPLPLGRRTHLRLAAQAEAATRPLRPTRRDPRSLPRPRLLPGLLQEAPAVIVIRSLRRQCEERQVVREVDLALLGHLVAPADGFRERGLLRGC